MLGCERAATALASRSKRSCGSRARRSGRTFDGHLSSHPWIAGAVHLANAAGAEGRQNVVGAQSRFRQKDSFPLRRQAPPDFVEEVHLEHYMILNFTCLADVRRHQRDKALAVTREIEVSARSDVR